MKIKGDKSKVGGRELSVDDFKLKKVLGKGSFGKVRRDRAPRARDAPTNAAQVMLVTLKTDPDGKLLAMKTLRKAALIKRNQLVRPRRPATGARPPRRPPVRFETADASSRLP